MIKILLLVTYDVETKTESGAKRLRHVAKICLDYGQRVQNSVFECSVDPAQDVNLKNDLKKIIDLEKDSIMIYNLGKNWERRVERIGKDITYNPDSGILLI